jgi:four helix bundle protein
MASRNYRDLYAWQKAMNLVEEIYRESKNFPKEEIYALTNQMRRCAVSIPSNIAEGQGRGTSREFVHFLRIAYGSLRELETQVIIAQRLQYLTPDAAAKLLSVASEVGRLLVGLMKSKE